MRTLRNAVIIDIGILLGCLVALYLSPDWTPLWFYALACFVAIVAINLAVFLGPRLRKKTGTSAKTNSLQSVTVWIILALGLLAIILRRLGLVSW